MTEDEKYYRQEWMSDDQWEATQFIADLMHGFHHVSGKFKPCGQGIEMNTRHARLATFDYDGLTRAVVMAHDRCIRFEVSPSGPGMICLLVHKRHSREGSMFERHPTLEEHVAQIRSSFPSQSGQAKETD